VRHEQALRRGGSLGLVTSSKGGSLITVECGATDDV
jgi:hypothetical protein